MFDGSAVVLRASFVNAVLVQSAPDSADSTKFRRTTLRTTERWVDRSILQWAALLVVLSAAQSVLR